MNVKHNIRYAADISVQFVKRFRYIDTYDVLHLN